MVAILIMLLMLVLLNYTSILGQLAWTLFNNRILDHLLVPNGSKSMAIGSACSALSMITTIQLVLNKLCIFRLSLPYTAMCKVISTNDLFFQPSCSIFWQLYRESAVFGNASSSFSPNIGMLWSKLKTYWTIVQFLLKWPLDRMT